MAFVEKKAEELTENPFALIGKQWFLLTAGAPEHYNTMTASWGAMGVIWGEPSITAYVRTSRYTLPFMEENDLFTVCVFDESFRPALSFCGSHSGRDCDKAKETGLTPAALDGTTAFAQARLVFVCEKVYSQMMDEKNFVHPEICQKWYGKDPMHKMFIGRIRHIYVQE